MSYKMFSQQPATLADILANHAGWLSQWSQHTSGADQQIQVPSLACDVKTPLDVFAWSHYLCDYSTDPLVQLFIKGISEGFRIGFAYQRTNGRSARSNLRSALEHPQIVSEYLRKEVCEGRVAGPFSKSLVPIIVLG